MLNFLIPPVCDQIVLCARAIAVPVVQVKFLIPRVIICKKIAQNQCTVENTRRGLSKGKLTLTAITWSPTDTLVLFAHELKANSKRILVMQGSWGVIKILTDIHVPSIPNVQLNCVFLSSQH